MNDIDTLKSLTIQAETYYSQGLLEEAKDKYSDLLKFIEQNEKFSNNKSLVESINDKIDQIDDEVAKIDLEVETPNLSEGVQDLIVELFSFSDNKDIATVEGAVALAKFGQFERALEEFQKISNEDLQFEVNQNIEEATKHYNAMIHYLKESHNDIKNQSLQIMRYTRDLAEFYKKMKEEQGLRDRLSRYVGQNVLEKLVGSKEDILFENERKNVTVLFADIRSFTSISEKMSPADVVSMLNEYFSVATDIIFENSGVLDKFIGDELMAMFGLLPAGENSHSYNAVKTAIELQKGVETLTKSGSFLSKEPFEIGIGINTGNAIVGNVGSKNRMDYTAIGDSVNTAARLQAIAEGGEIIIGSETYEQVKDQFNLEKKGKVKLKNIKTPVECYKVIA